VWILAFFVAGVVIGLLLLVLQQGMPGSWTSLWRAGQPVPRTAQPHSNEPTAKAAPLPRQAEDSGEAATAGGQRHDQPLQCDRAAALKVMERARSLASMHEQGGRLTLNLTREWEYYSAGHRRSFVEVFSEADRCLQGQFRELHFLYQGREVASVSSGGAIEVK
jgi:hypothetical protein